MDVEGDANAVGLGLCSQVLELSRTETLRVEPDETERDPGRESRLGLLVNHQAQRGLRSLKSCSKRRRVGAGKRRARHFDGGVGRNTPFQQAAIACLFSAVDEDLLFLRRPEVRQRSQGAGRIPRCCAVQQMQTQPVGKNPVLAIDQGLAGNEYVGHGFNLSGGRWFIFGEVDSCGCRWKTQMNRR